MCSRPTLECPHQKSSILLPISSLEYEGRHPNTLHEHYYYDLHMQQSDLHNSCPSVEGRGEWVQYLRWFGKFPGASHLTDLNDMLNSSIPLNMQLTGTNHVKRFSYQVNYWKKFISFNLLSVRLILTQESVHGEEVAGSNFRIDIISNVTRQVCNVKDLNNGTYVSCCYVPIRSHTDDIYTISVFVQYVQFNAYAMHLSNSTLIWSKQMSLLSDISLQHYPQLMNTTLEMSAKEIRSQTAELSAKADVQSGKHHPTSQRLFCNTTHPEWLNGAWMNDSNGTPRYSPVGQQCDIPRVTEKEFKECITAKYNGSFTIIGDSHMLAIYDYLVNVTLGYLKLPQEKKSRRVDTQHQHLTYNWIYGCSSLVVKLESYVTKIQNLKLENPNQQHLLVFDVLAWDLMLENYHVVRYVNTVVS